jgi:hypothetical protein
MISSLITNNMAPAANASDSGMNGQADRSSLSQRAADQSMKSFKLLK